MKTAFSNLAIVRLLLMIAKSQGTFAFFAGSLHLPSHRVTRPGLVMQGQGHQVIVVGLNGALQKTLTFKGLEVGRVNRASQAGTGVGGKGQNVCVALRNQGGDVAVSLVQFTGGSTGMAVRDKMSSLGVTLVEVETAAEMRTCTSLVDERFGETTEVIEPWSGNVGSGELDSLVQACRDSFRDVPRIHGLAFMGSLPGGLPADAYAQIMDAVAASPGFADPDTRVLADTTNGFEPLVSTGHVDLLKVNAEELLLLADVGEDEPSVWMEDKLGKAVKRLFRKHPRLPWIAVTNGGLPAYLYSHIFFDAHDDKLTSFWRYTLPFVDAVNPIGAGDAVAAGTMFAWSQGMPLPQAFEQGLAAGCASCQNRDPISNACFDASEAEALLGDIRVQSVEGYLP